ncbi:hypothetical protein RND81_08G085800 [Saponaria officinalis]|uniref:Replication protein A OB domain-containing protein n=1 Tax=Saponaria officinalis TaxID=3572 RepID=A0AAW1J575_SAPOF
MRGALFGDQVEGYKDVFVYNGVYEIANAPIKPCEAQWKSIPNDMDFQMTFGRQTIIQPIETQTGPILPQYQAIAQLPKVVDGDEKFDVLGIVVYMEEKARKVITAQQRELVVREIVIVDHSVEQPLFISAWNDLAENDCESLSSSAENFDIVGLTALKVSTHKGFSLTTTMSTTIIHTPNGERAEGLKDWASRHQELLANIRTRVLEEERHWLKVTILEPEFDKINAYLRCSNCGTRAEVSAGHVICSPRVTFNCDVSDGSESLAITTFTEDSEKLFRMTAADIFRIEHSEDRAAFEKVQQLFQTTSILIQVGLKATLSCNNILKRVLKKLVICNTDPKTGVKDPEKITATPEKIGVQDPEKTSEKDLKHSEVNSVEIPKQTSSPPAANSKLPAHTTSQQIPPTDEKPKKQETTAMCVKKQVPETASEDGARSVN